LNLKNHFFNNPAAYKIGCRTLGYIPRVISYMFSQIIADITYLAYNNVVKNVKKNITIALPTASQKEISRTSKRLFRNYSKYLVDFGRFAGLKKSLVPKLITDVEGKEFLEDALKIDKGLILLTAHIGNWELGGIFFGSYGVKTSVVTLQDENLEIHKIREWYRSCYGVNTITIGNSPFSSIEMMEALKKKEIVAMLIDGYKIGLDGITTEFFNKPTKFTRGPFILSRLTGAPIVMAFVISTREGYKGIIEKPFIVHTKDDEQDAVKTVVDSLEKIIVQYPDQWYIFDPI